MEFKASKQQGFTVLELVVALAVIAILTAAVAPQLLGQLEKARRLRAKQDMHAIAGAMQRFYDDVGRMPNVNRAGQPIGIHLMFSSTGRNASHSTCGTQVGGMQMYSCCWRSDTCWGPSWSSTVKSNLILNTPGYSGWRGPYLDADRADPWGNHYSVVTFGMTYYANCDRGGYWCRNSVVVASAGPNGVWETDPHMDRSTCRGGRTDWDPHACGDDLIVVVANRAGTTQAAVTP